MPYLLPTNYTKLTKDPTIQHNNTDSSLLLINPQNPDHIIFPPGLNTSEHSKRVHEANLCNIGTQFTGTVPEPFTKINALLK